MMFYLDTNVVIALTIQNYHFSELEQRRCFTSIFTIQELLKKIGKHLEDQEYIEARLKTIRWIDSNGLLKDFDTVNMKIVSGFGLMLKNSFAGNFRNVINKICENRGFDSIYNENEDVFIENDRELKFLNTYMPRQTEKSDFNLKDYDIDKKKAFSKFLNEVEIPILDEMNEFLVQSNLKNLLAIALSINDIELTEENIQKCWSRYKGMLDALSRGMVGLIGNYLITEKMKYNDYVDIFHLVYLQNSTNKIVTDDKGFRRMVKKALGDRRSLTTNQLLEKFESL